MAGLYGPSVDLPADSFADLLRQLTSDPAALKEKLDSIQAATEKHRAAQAAAVAATTQASTLQAKAQELHNAATKKEAALKARELDLEAKLAALVEREKTLAKEEADFENLRQAATAALAARKRK